MTAPSMNANTRPYEIVFSNSDDLWVSLKAKWVLVPHDTLKMYELFNNVKINFDFETFERQLRIAQQKLKEKQIALLYSSIGYARLQYLVDEYDTEDNRMYYTDDAWLHESRNESEEMARQEFRELFGDDKQFEYTPVVSTTDIEIVRQFISQNKPIVARGRHMDNDSIKITKKVFDTTLEGFKVGINKSYLYTDFVIYKLPDVE